MELDTRKLLELESLVLPAEAAVEAALIGVPAPRSADALLAKFCSLGVTASDLVIDLGCGHGQYSQQIASVVGCKVVALDQSLARVVETRTATGNAILSGWHASACEADD